MHDEVSETENIRKNLSIERMIVDGCDILLDVNQVFVRQGTLIQVICDKPRSSRSRLSTFGTLSRDRKEAIRQVFLFTNHLLITARTNNGRLRLVKNYGKISLVECTLVEDTGASLFNGDEDGLNLNEQTLDTNKSSDKSRYPTKSVNSPLSEMNTSGSVTIPNRTQSELISNSNSSIRTDSGLSSASHIIKKPMRVESALRYPTSFTVNSCNNPIPFTSCRNIVEPEHRHSTSLCTDVSTEYDSRSIGTKNPSHTRSSLQTPSSSIGNEVSGSIPNASVPLIHRLGSNFGFAFSNVGGNNTSTMATEKLDYGNLDFRLVWEPKDGQTTNIWLVASTLQEKAAWCSDISQCIEQLHYSDILNSAQSDVSSVTMPQSIRSDPRLFKDDVDIKFSQTMNSCKVPQIRHATVDRLLDRLTDARFLSIDFLNTFLLTYRVFTTGLNVILALKQLLLMPQVEVEPNVTMGQGVTQSSSGGSISGPNEHKSSRDMQNSPTNGRLPALLEKTHKPEDLPSKLSVLLSGDGVTSTAQRSSSCAQKDALSGERFSTGKATVSKRPVSTSEYITHQDSLEVNPSLEKRSVKHRMCHSETAYTHEDRGIVRNGAENLCSKGRSVGSSNDPIDPQMRSSQRLSGSQSGNSPPPLIPRSPIFRGLLNARDDPPLELPDLSNLSKHSCHSTRPSITLEPGTSGQSTQRQSQDDDCSACADQPQEVTQLNCSLTALDRLVLDREDKANTCAENSHLMEVNSSCLVEYLNQNVSSAGKKSESEAKYHKQKPAALNIGLSIGQNGKTRVGSYTSFAESLDLATKLKVTPRDRPTKHACQTLAKSAMFAALQCPGGIVSKRMGLEQQHGNEQEDLSECDDSFVPFYPGFVRSSPSSPQPHCSGSMQLKLPFPRSDGGVTARKDNGKAGANENSLNVISSTENRPPQCSASSFMMCNHHDPIPGHSMDSSRGSVVSWSGTPAERNPKRPSVFSCPDGDVTSTRIGVLPTNFPGHINVGRTRAGAVVTSSRRSRRRSSNTAAVQAFAVATAGSASPLAATGIMGFGPQSPYRYSLRFPNNIAVTMKSMSTTSTATTASSASTALVPGAARDVASCSPLTSVVVSNHSSSNPARVVPRNVATESNGTFGVPIQHSSNSCSIALHARKSLMMTASCLRVLNVVRHWITKFPDDFDGDPVLKNEIKELLEALVVCPHLLVNDQRAAGQLLKQILNGQLVRDRIDLDDILTPTQIPSEKNFDTLSALDISEQLTFLDFQIFRSIRSEELLNQSWMKPDKEEKAKHVLLVCKRFNEVSRLVVSEIISRTDLNDRVSCIDKWVAIADICRCLQNYNGVLQICAALVNSSIYRLRRTWERVGKQTKQSIDRLQMLVASDGRFKSMREALHRCDPPCIPYLGMYLTDLSFIEEGALNVTENNLVNFCKMRMIAHVIREIQQYHQTPYMITHRREVTDYLLDTTRLLDDEETYKASLTIEPRQSINRQPSTQLT